MDAVKKVFVLLAVFIVWSSINWKFAAPYYADEHSIQHQYLGERFGRWTQGLFSPRECILVDSTMPKHTEAVYNFEEQLQQIPAQVEYCDGEHPFWKATWSVFKSQPGWQKYAVGTFRYINYDNNAHTAHIRIKWYVENTDTNEIVELESEISITQVIALYNAAKTLYPGQKLHGLKHTTVKDGGTWTEKDHGFQLRMLDAPEYSGGSIIPFVIDCESGCAWGPSRFHYRKFRIEVIDAQSKYSIQLTHKIDLDRIAEIISTTRLHIHPEDRIRSIKYVGVGNGGSWSEEAYGYVVDVAKQPGYGRGDYLYIKKDCSTYPCEWAVKKRAGWVL